MNSKCMQSLALALVFSLFSLPSLATKGDSAFDSNRDGNCFRVHVVYLLETATGEMEPQLATCLNRDNADEFQSCFNNSVEVGFNVRQAVAACRAKYSVSLFDGRI